MKKENIVNELEDMISKYNYRIKNLRETIEEIKILGKRTKALPFEITIKCINMYMKMKI